jgi:uncharacterized protein YaaW (UPF0174 family)
MPVRDTIFQRLRAATDGELRGIAEALAVNLSGEREVDVVNLSKEYRSCAGNSIANLGRGDHDFPYKQILVDVADKEEDGLGWSDFALSDGSSELEIENALLRNVEAKLREKLADCSPEERAELKAKFEDELKSRGYSPAQAAAVASVFGGAAGAVFATPLAAALWYGGVFGAVKLAIWGVATRALFAAAGGILVAGASALTLVFWATMPGYKKVIPATYRLIAVRLRMEEEERLGNP